MFFRLVKLSRAGFLLGILYFLASLIGFKLRIASGMPPMIWFASGVGFAGLIVGGTRLWPWIAVAALAFDLVRGFPPITTVFLTAGKTLESWVAASLLVRWCRPRVPSLASVREILAFLGLSVIIGGLVGTFIGAIGLHLGGVSTSRHLISLTGDWWMEDALGILLIGTLPLVWDSRWMPSSVARGFWRDWQLPLLTLATLVVSALVYTPLAHGHQSVMIRPYLLFPLMMWAAIRFGAWGALLIFYIICGCAIDGILNQFVPAAASSNDLADQMLFQKGLFLVIGAVGLIISAAIREKEDALKVRQEFLSTASHELRTPLTSLFLQAQSRLRKMNKSSSEDVFSAEKLKEMFSTDIRQLRQLSKLVDDMLDISRLSTGKFSVEREPGSLSVLVSDLLLRLKPQLEAMGSELHINYDGSDPFLGEWDALRLEQAVTNLVINAGKYGLKRPVSVRLNRVGKKAHLQIEDQGRGIAPEDQARIFKPFERAVTVSEVSGLGLGLYISSQIIQAHGGRISLQSQVGQGSTFTLELPLTIFEDESKSASSSRQSVLSRG